jgi:hypothetical protein
MYPRRPPPASNRTVSIFASREVESGSGLPRSATGERRPSPQVCPSAAFCTGSGRNVSARLAAPDQDDITIAWCFGQKGVSGDVAAGSVDPAKAKRSGRGAALGVPVPDGRQRLEAGAAWGLRLRAGRGGGFGAGAGAAAARAASVEVADRLRTCRGVLGAARRRPGDDREAALAAGKGRRRLRRAAGRGAPLRRDRRLANRALAGLPLRRDSGAAAGSRACGALGNDRRQPGEARRGQPVAAAQGAAPVRVVGRARCRRRESRASLSADGALRRCHWASPGRVACARMARRRSGGAGSSTSTARLRRVG